MEHADTIAQPEEPSAEEQPRPSRSKAWFSKLTWRRAALVVGSLLLLADVVYLHVLLLAAAGSSASAASAAWSVEREVTREGYGNTFRKQIEQIQDDVEDIERQLTTSGGYSGTIKQKLDRIASDLSDLEDDVKYIRRNM